jgi:aryl-alcohol dehydrogenase-like predicted oxidoreductase
LIAEIAKQIEVTPAQLSIAWCLKNPHVSSVILGASRSSQLEENLKAMEVLPKLTSSVMNEIAKVI